MRYVNSHIPHMTVSIWISVVVLVLLKSQLRDLIHFPQACLVLDLQRKNKFLPVVNYLIALPLKPS